MILIALLMFQATLTPVPVEDDIVVIAERLERWKATVKFGKDGPRCDIKRSSGDAEIDRIGCTAMTTCIPQFQSRYAATSDRAIKPATRKVMQSALNGELTDCVTRQRKALIADLAAKRRAAKPSS